MLCARALSQRDAVNCVKPLSTAICDATTAVVSALFSIVLFNKSMICSICMEKLKQILVSKKFWTLIAAIVAALAAFFTVGCAVQAKVRREGVHIDTVRVDYIVRSRSFTTT